MKITYRGDYALKAILELAIRYEDNKNIIVPINEIAKFGDMPKKFLEQILLTLVRGGLVKSKRGAGGGFILARRPVDITVGEVIRLIEPKLVIPMHYQTELARPDLQPLSRFLKETGHAEPPPPQPKLVVSKSSFPTSNLAVLDYPKPSA